MDQPIAEFETDKATVELPAEKAGKISFVASEGDDLAIGDMICTLDTKAKAPAKKAEPKEEAVVAEAAAPAPAKEENKAAETSASKEKSYATGTPSPAARKLIEENGINADKVNGSGRDGRITKGDVLQAIQVPHS